MCCLGGAAHDYMATWGDTRPAIQQEHKLVKVQR
jgi:hypothetical protein